MKKILTVLLLCVTISNYAQKTDLYVCELANKLDWFALNNEYPKLKDSVRACFHIISTDRKNP